MKEYNKPSLTFIELKSDEVFAAGSGLTAGLVMPNNPDEVETLDLLGLNTKIFVK